MPHRFTRQRYLLAFILLLAASVSSCDSPTDPRDSNLIAFGTVSTGHLAAGEEKRFEVEAKAGQAFAVYVEVTSGSVRLALRDSAQEISHLDVYPGLTTQVNGLAVSSGPRTRYTIVLSAPEPTDFTLRPTLINMAPEHVPQLITLGAVISGERIDHPFDQDEFLVDIPAAQEAELYLSSDVGHFFYVTVVRVGGLYLGPYRLVAVAIDPRPEGRDDVIAPSRSGIASALELYGDIDVFRFTLNAPTRSALRCAPTPGGGCSVYSAAVYRDDTPTTPVNLEFPPTPYPVPATRGAMSQICVECQMGTVTAELGTSGV